MLKAQPAQSMLGILTLKTSVEVGSTDRLQPFSSLPIMAGNAAAPMTIKLVIHKKAPVHLLPLFEVQSSASHPVRPLRNVKIHAIVSSVNATAIRSGRHFEKKPATANPLIPNSNATNGPMQHMEPAMAATTLPARPVRLMV